MSYYFPEILPSYAMHHDACKYSIALHAYLMIALFVYKCSNIKWNLFLSTILYFHLDWITTTWQWLFQTLLQVPIYNVMLNIRSSVCIIPLRYRLICIINIDFINFAKQSLSLMTSLFLSYTFSYTTDFYLLESYPWFAVLKTFMNIIFVYQNARSTFHISQSQASYF